MADASHYTPQGAILNPEHSENWQSIGQLATRKWQDQSGADRYTTEVVLRPYRGELTLLDGRGESGGGAGGGYDDRPAPASGGGQQGGMGPSDLDDEIPF